MHVENSSERGYVLSSIGDYDYKDYNTIPYHFGCRLKLIWVKDFLHFLIRNNLSPLICGLSCSPCSLGCKCRV